MERWPAPSVFRRSWCLFEMYHAALLQKPFEYAAASDVVKTIDGGFVKKKGEWNNGWTQGIEWDDWSPSEEQLALVKRVDLREAEASFPEDKERIDAAVASDVGFEAMNTMVQDAIVSHLYRARCADRRKETEKKIEVNLGEGFMMM